MADLCRRGEALEDEDFQETEVWDSLNGNEFSKGKKAREYSFGSSSTSAWGLSSSGPRVIPKANSCSHEQTVAGRQSSAPVDIPDWSKILKRNSKNKDFEDEDCDSDDDTKKRAFDGADCFQNDDEEEEMVPPHEYLARRLAGTQIASFSMLEGVGRTLKGRDLSKLRNAILTKTGFLE